MSTYAHVLLQLQSYERRVIRIEVKDQPESKDSREDKAAGVGSAEGLEQATSTQAGRPTATEHSRGSLEDAQETAPKEVSKSSAPAAAVKAGRCEWTSKGEQVDQRPRRMDPHRRRAQPVRRL